MCPADPALGEAFRLYLIALPTRPVSLLSRVGHPRGRVLNSEKFVAHISEDCPRAAVTP
jgi:hypothetical protein